MKTKKGAQNNCYEIKSDTKAQIVLVKIFKPKHYLFYKNVFVQNNGEFMLPFTADEGMIVSACNSQYFNRPKLAFVAILPMADMAHIFSVLSSTLKCSSWKKGQTMAM